MDVNEYIESGVLELYVAGALSEEENREVYKAIQEYPEVKKECREIIRALISLLYIVMRAKDQYPDL
ncbi:hypothetical protein [Leptobacterium flavescens]|uniref:hypothetical protein n=1 Tax=Leptobacterium flavescens TaxID=472055 RepID=UPI001954C957|nr:hypothetical protein [Leptobacterium flavescens]